MGQKAFYVNMNECSGCRCCQVACKDTKNLPVGAFFREVHDFEGGEFPRTWAASLSLGCNHCSDPQCAKNCPVAAQKKQSDTGLVVQDRTMCIGCGKCIVSCPYEAPAFIEERDTVEKCDGCVELVRQGKSPACVAACSTRCLRFGDADELGTRYADFQLVSDLNGLPDSAITKPNLFIVPKAEMLS